ncbi:PBP1A family penicillin-binding protein [Anaerocolumna sp. AGMB13025]|uniref:transglycosylase domain-containing protein n=1 Tax=Anaerocolumna sp. AGMB13025 TaxID=3039116 RepID=UPI00241E129C|nr:PBP1A family penicillin-binding protein [Anaerocolumna sp. AGMB13025]WFR57261.1 PBP1A family penicillin-binding protein [Anaerocolumna sp. AGMB13025]
MENNTTRTNQNTSNRNTSNQNRNTSSNTAKKTSNSQKNRNIHKKTNIDGTKPQKKKHRSKFRKRLHWILLISSFVFSMSMLIGILVIYLKYGDDFTNYQKEAEKLVGESTPDTFRQAETSLVYGSNKKLISVLKGVKDVYYLSYDDIPTEAVGAMISIEDKKFMEHAGIDLKANIRAAIALIKHKGGVTQGASTITQQLARGIFLTNEVSIERKLKEIFISVELEKKYSKEQIMEFYLNNIYFANGYYGIQAASRGYFNKTVDKLSLSQIAFLCAIPNNPTLYDPEDHPENTVKRRDRILLQMYKDGRIDKEEYDDACNEEIKLVQKKLTKNNYVETYVFYSATRALMAKEGFEFRNVFDSDEDRKEYELKYNEAYNRLQKSLYTEGYRIYTSIDLKKQKELQTAVDENLKAFTDKNKDGIFTLQGAAVSIENKTGRVVAIVGGRYQKSVGYTLNRGYQSFRQPGSSIKPLIVYTPTFENGRYPEDIVTDEKFEGGPSNSDGVYLGKIPIRKAVEKSKNTVAWRLFEELTPKVGLSYLLKMNFSKIDKNDYYPAASLGGLTNGASPVEMTAGYATLENDGVYREPTCIVKITDSEGNLIVEENKSKKRIYDVNAARMMTDVMTGVIIRGTGAGLGLDNMASAGKTGTTNEKKDGWFVGFTPYYTTGVWVGYDIPKAMSGLSGATYPGSIWKQYMNAIHKGLEYKAFTPYEDNHIPENTQEETIETQETQETTETQEQTGENTGTEDQTIDSGDTEEDPGDTSGTPGDNDDGWGDNSQEDGTTIDDGQSDYPGTDDSSGNGSEDDSWGNGNSWDDQGKSVNGGNP